jgi:hypothetical protein
MKTSPTRVGVLPFRTKSRQSELSQNAQSQDGAFRSCPCSWKHGELLRMAGKRVLALVERRRSRDGTIV